MPAAQLCPEKGRLQRGEEMATSWSCNITRERASHVDEEENPGRPLPHPKKPLAQGVSEMSQMFLWFKRTLNHYFYLKKKESSLEEPSILSVLFAEPRG